jgi:hypothetical protein
MSATNINMTIPKPSMYYDCTYPFSCFKKSTAVNTDDILKKQYNYSKAFISHGGLVGETIDENTEGNRKKQYTYSGATVNHGESIEDVPETPIKKKYMWTSFVDFFKQRQKFQRHPFAHTPNI